MTGTWVDVYERWHRSVLRLVVTNDNTGQNSMGTGWLIAIAPDDGGARRFVLATAAHVIEPALISDGSINIYNSSNHYIHTIDRRNSKIFTPEDIKQLDVGIISASVDAKSARLLGSRVPVSTSCAEEPMHPTLRVGSEVCWIGYPGIITGVVMQGYYDNPTPVFCAGHIAAVGHKDEFLHYLIDGNVNRGMSGGLVLTRDGVAIGSVTAVHGATLMNMKELPYRNFGVVCPTGLIVHVMNQVRDKLDVEWVQPQHLMQDGESSPIPES
jgi:hypothetical protein